MSQNTDFNSIAEKLVNGKPLSFKNYPDGSLVVIAPTGQKFKFTAAQVQQTEKDLKPKPKPKSKPTTKKKTASKASKSTKANKT